MKKLKLNKQIQANLSKKEEASIKGGAFLSQGINLCSWLLSCDEMNVCPGEEEPGPAGPSMAESCMYGCSTATVDDCP